MVQRKVENAEVGSDIESGINAIKGGGQSLPDSVRNFFEPRFGYDFGGVRVHSDAKASELSHGVNAKAFTIGKEVFFGTGQYKPESEEGKSLLAHELVHTIQQRDSHAINQDIWVQRWHFENGRKKFDCQDYAPDSKLEACLNDEDRLRPFDTGDSVIRVQTGLQADGVYKGKISGIYDADTGQAVMAFKRKYHLGFYQYPDVGPGTMGKLDKLCAASIGPPEAKPPTQDQPPITVVPPWMEQPPRIGPIIPKSVNCDDNQNSELPMAYPIAIDMVRTARRALLQTPSAKTRKYLRWYFKDDSTRTQHHVLIGLKNMLDGLTSNVTFECEKEGSFLFWTCDGSHFGYTSRAGLTNIHLCPAAFGRSDTLFLPTVITHESSHKFDHTDDKADCTLINRGCPDDLDTDDAYNNADSFSEFARAIYISHSHEY